jgi:hypothetical protein
MLLDNRQLRTKLCNKDIIANRLMQSEVGQGALRVFSISHGADRVAPPSLSSIADSR